MGGSARLRDGSPPVAEAAATSHRPAAELSAVELAQALAQHQAGRSSPSASAVDGLSAMQAVVSNRSVTAGLSQPPTQVEPEEDPNQDAERELEHQLLVLTPQPEPQLPRDEGVEYRDFSGNPAFVQGAGDEADIDQNDVEQAMGNCWLMASLIAVARTNRALIRRMIHASADGTFDVTLILPDPTWPDHRIMGVPAPLKPQTFLVRPTLPAYKNTYDPVTKSPGMYGAALGDLAPDGGNELWVALIVKAFAEAKKHGYPGLEGGRSPEAFQALGAIDVVIHFSNPYENHPGGLGRELGAALEGGKAVTVSTQSEETSDALQLGIHPSHVYAPFAVDGDTIQLRDPNNRDSLTVVPAAALESMLAYWVEATLPVLT